MSNEFKVQQYKDATVYTLESASGGSTSAGSVASVSMPIGGVRKRGDNLIAQEADKNTVPSTTPRNFVAKNAKMGGAGAHRDKKKEQKQGVEKHKKPYMEDHADAANGWGAGSYDTYAGGRHGRGVAENPEWYNDEANSMSTSQLKSLYKHAVKLRQAVKQMQAQGDTLEPWQQSKVTKAADYLDAVFNAVDDEHDMGEDQGGAAGSLNELSKDTLKSYSNERGATIHADQRDAGGARTMAADKKKHGDTKASADWDDEASWLDKRAEKGAKGVAQATTKIAKKGVAEGEGAEQGAYPHDFQKFQQDAQAYGFSIVKAPQDQTGNGTQNFQVLNNQKQMVGFWDGNAGNGTIAKTPQEYQQKITSAGGMSNYGRNQYQKDVSAYYGKGVAEGSGEAEAYKAHLIKTMPQMMNFLSKKVKGWTPGKEEMLGAIDTAYMVMKHTGDVKQAGKAMMDELNTLHRMSQGKQGVAEGWSQKYKKSINCSHPKGFSQKAHCAGKKKHNESIEMEMTCPDCGMCQTHGNNMMEVKQRLDAKCWTGKHKEGTKIKGGVRVNNCVPNEGVEEGDAYMESLQNMLERSVSQAQHNLMVGVAHNPQFAQQVKVKQKVGQEFAQADVGHDISKLPIRVPKKK